MDFKLEGKDKGSSARAGTLTTDHGEIRTPIFMPVGTLGSVKAVSQTDLRDEVGADIILGNTYHLYLRPGMDTMKKAGGLHKFMNWDGPILTDSGGYQVYSLSHKRKLTEEGAHFKNHINGDKILFTPENVMDIQRTIGADIIMAFDECPPYPCTKEYAKTSMGRTHRWLDRCVNRLAETDSYYDHNQELFPILQGGGYRDLRIESAKYISNVEAAGYAIGGLSVGEPAEEMYETAELVCRILPENKPRYLMGVGTPVNLLENIALGVDMFDCVMPTRNARTGTVYTWNGVMNIKNKKWEQDFSALDPAGFAIVDKMYSKSYVRHLLRANEILALNILSIHNLVFYLDLVREARKHILTGNFSEWKEKMVVQLSNRL